MALPGRYRVRPSRKREGELLPRDHIMIIKRCLLASLFALLCAFHIEAQDAREILGRAVAVWHLSDLHDQAGADSALEVRGKVELGVPLDEQAQHESKARGGDGKAARLSGDGWLSAGDGHNRELQLQGDKCTVLMRLQATAGIWETRGLFSRGGGHDKLVVNMFSHDFGHGPEIGFEIGVEGKPGLGGQVRASLDRVGRDRWHDVVARYDGRELSLYLDGVLLDRKPAAGVLRQGNVEPLAIGAGTSGGHTDAPLVGMVDHAAIWSAALSDDEIVTLCGGKAIAAKNEAEYAAWVPPPPRRSIDDLVNTHRELQARFQADPQRPQWHFLAPEEGDCMPFDPNGAIYWKGRYHLFYIFQRQQNADPPVVHCWGHVSSTDLVHWKTYPTALDVAAADPDRGIFSGNAFLNRDGVPTIMYHGVGLGNCIATSTDDELVHWTKSPQNPIVPLPKPGTPEHGLYESWDPHGWYEGSQYYAIFGGAKAALMKGDDLHALKYQRPFLAEDRWAEQGEDMSCPDFFKLGDRYVLLGISHRRGARYYVGDWKGDIFTPTAHERMNWPGGAFFAPETMLDGKGRRLLWGWAFDPRSDSRRRAGGWSGVMSMPRELSLDANGKMLIRPVHELEALRHDEWDGGKRKLLAGKASALALQGESLELDVTFAPSAANRVGVTVRQNASGEEATVIAYDRKSQQLSIDFSKASLDRTIRYKSWFFHQPLDAEDTARRVEEQVAPFSLADDQPLRLRVFLDRSMLEVYANDRLCMTQRIFPTLPESTGVSLWSEGADTEVTHLRGWRLE